MWSWRKIRELLFITKVVDFVAWKHLSLCCKCDASDNHEAGMESFFYIWCIFQDLSSSRISLFFCLNFWAQQCIFELGGIGVTSLWAVLLDGQTVFFFFFFYCQNKHLLDDVSYSIKSLHVKCCLPITRGRSRFMPFLKIFWWSECMKSQLKFWLTNSIFHAIPQTLI